MDFAATGLGRTKVTLTGALFFVIVLSTATFLRLSLLLTYPLLVILFVAHFRLKFMSALTVLVLMIGVGWLLSLSNGWYPVYNLVSFYYVLPFLLLFFAVPGDPAKYRQPDLVKLFFKILTWFALVNDVVGFWQFLDKSYSDDNFTGIYASFTISLNGLVLLNAIVSFYYFALYLHHKKKLDLFAAAFFMLSSIMGFFGAGLMVIILAIVLSFVRLSLWKLIKTALIATIILVVGYYSLLLVRPKIVRYNKSNIDAILKFDMQTGPRKLTVFYNYAVAYPSNTRDFLFGSGPGTFNSRSAFMVGSPSYFNTVTFLKSKKMPYYFENYAYTLWNDTNTSQAAYMDGFRNQPFSSVLAFLGEYGLIATILLMIGYYHYYSKVRRLRLINKAPLGNSYQLLFKFLAVLLVFLLLIDNFLEYPEIILLIVVIMKLIHIELVRQRYREREGQLAAAE